MTNSMLATYPEWLASQVSPNRRRNFDDLFDIMHAKEFIFVISNDRNRVQDAKDLRSEFFRDIGMKSYVTTDVLGPISVLEIMIALSRRLNFMTSVHPGEWAWVLLQNIGLSKYSGHISRRWATEIDDILERLIWRTYTNDGQGGFFPLAWPNENQRYVELWYQMNAYLAEAEDPHDHAY